MISIKMSLECSHLTRAWRSTVRMPTGLVACSCLHLGTPAMAWGSKAMVPAGLPLLPTWGSAASVWGHWPGSGGPVLGCLWVWLHLGLSAGCATGCHLAAFSHVLLSVSTSLVASLIASWIIIEILGQQCNRDWGIQSPYTSVCGWVCMGQSGSGNPVEGWRLGAFHPGGAHIGEAEESQVLPSSENP